MKKGLTVFVVCMMMFVTFAAGAEKTKIEIWLEPSAELVGEEGDCYQQTTVNAFNSQSSTIELEVVLQPNSWDATRTALAGGAGPDLVGTPGPSFAFELAQAGRLLSLDDAAEKFGWADRFASWALTLGEVDGHLYSVPNEYETLVLYYNKTLFEEYGWTLPNTMAELMTLAEQIAAEGIIPFGHGNSEWRPANEWFVGEMFNQVAGPQAVYEALTGKRPWTDPLFVEAIDILTTMQQNGWFMGGLDRYYTATFDEFRGALGNGEAAMNIEGSWFLEEIDNFFGEAAGNDNEWDWVPVPSKGGEAIFDLGIGSTWSVNAASQNPEAALEYLNFYYSTEVQSQLLVACNFAPAPVELTAGALEQIDPRRSRLYSELLKSSEAGDYGYTTWTFWPPKSDAYIYEEIERVWAGQITSAEYLSGLQELFAAELAAGDIPPIPSR